MESAPGPEQQLGSEGGLCLLRLKESWPPRGTPGRSGRRRRGPEGRRGCRRRARRRDEPPRRS
eukprot:2244630-Alexandrium_andersonii.AAC.1